MTMLRVYKSTMPSMSVILANGKPCIFVNGYYRTDNPMEIGTLDSEVKAGHPHIFIDPNEVEVDSTLVDPMAALRHKIIEEYKASQEAAAGDPNRDMGTSDQTQKLNVSTSADIAQAAAGGSGMPLAARLMALTANKSGGTLMTPVPAVQGGAGEVTTGTTVDNVSKQ